MKLFIALGIARDGFLMCLQLLRSEQQLEEDFRMKSLFLKNFKFLSIFFPFLNYFYHYYYITSQIIHILIPRLISQFSLYEDQKEFALSRL